MDKQNPVFVRIILILLFLILLIHSLIAAKDFLYPLALAVLFAYMLYPFVKFLEKRRIPRILANLMGILSAIVVISGIIYLLSIQLGTFVEDFPALKKQALANVDELNEAINKKLEISVDIKRDIIKERLAHLF